MKHFHEYIDIYAELNEIDQEGTIKFCFANEDDSAYFGMHPFVKCRDFLNDVVIASHIEDTVPSIYGFRYDGKTRAIDKDKTRLVVRVSSDEEAANLIQNKLKFNNMITYCGMERTIIKPIEIKGKESNTLTSNHYFLVEGDKRWSDHIVSMSFYSLMLRIMSANKIKKRQTFAEFMQDIDVHSSNDQEYLMSFNRAFTHPSKFINNIELLSMSNVIQSMEYFEELEYAHNNGGIQTFSDLVSAFSNKIPFNYIEYLNFEGTVDDWTADDDDDPALYQPNYYYAQRFALAI